MSPETLERAGLLTLLVVCCRCAAGEAATGRQTRRRSGPATSLWAPLNGTGVAGSATRSDGVQVGCKELRSQRYLSDGLCTSVRPITEVLCTGHCVPPRQLPWYAQFVKVWARTKVLEWRCVTAVVRHQRVSLLCDNGDTRTYRVRVVKACKCKRYMSPQNRTTGGKPARRRRVDGQERRRRRRRRRRRKEERRQAARHQDL